MVDVCIGGEYGQTSVSPKMVPAMVEGDDCILDVSRCYKLFQLDQTVLAVQRGQAEEGPTDHSCTAALFVER